MLWLLDGSQPFLELEPEESQFQSSLTVRERRPRLEISSVDARQAFVTAIETEEGFTYTVEASDDLGARSWMDASETFRGTGDLPVTLKVPHLTDEHLERRFFRLRGSK